MNEEYLDLVDTNDQKIGTIGRSQLSELKDGGGKYVRASYAFIQNSKGELWIPRRTASKRIAPNGLDMAMAEHMGVDETYLDAAIRGFQEELNLAVQSSDLKLLGILSPLPGLPYFGAYYIYQANEEPRYNIDDFSEAHWMAPEEVLNRIASGEVAKLCLKPGIELLKIYVFAHNDLRFQNILLDPENMKIKGLIDWSDMSIAPIEKEFSSSSWSDEELVDAIALYPKRTIKSIDLDQVLRWRWIEDVSDFIELSDADSDAAGKILERLYNQACKGRS